MNRNENGIIAANIIEAGYLRSHSSPFIWAIRNACLIASKKEDRISLFLSLLALLPVLLVCTTVLLLSATLSNNASFCQKSIILHIRFYSRSGHLHVMQQNPKVITLREAFVYWQVCLGAITTRHNEPIQHKKWQLCRLIVYMNEVSVWLCQFDNAASITPWLQFFQSILLIWHHDFVGRYIPPIDDCP